MNRLELTEAHVIAHGGWHPTYARVLAIAADGDWALAVVDGNGDGAELEAETWEWGGHHWLPSTSWGAGHLDLATAHTQGHGAGYNETSAGHYAHGVAPLRDHVTITFDGQQHEVPVSPLGVWAFIKTTRPDKNPGPPSWTP